MPESSSSFVPLKTLQDGGGPPELAEFVDEVLRVARRLDHNVLSLEHALVVGAERGLGDMARSVASLSAFREALLDALFDDRQQFRYEREAGDEAVWVKPALARLVRRLREGANLEDLLADGMQDDEARIRKAVAFARGSEPEVLPPDTITLEQLSLDETQQLPRAPSAAARDGDEDGAAAAEAGAPKAAGGSEGDGSDDDEARAPELPFTADLGHEAREDLPLVGRDALLDQVARMLLRFQEASVLITGAAGTGKTAFVRGLARAARDGSLPALEGFRFYRLKLLDLVAQSHRGQDVHALVDQILAAVASDAKSVLVIDDLHLLVAKQGYPMMSDLIDTVKIHIDKGKVRALLTVDSEVFERSFSNDPFFSAQITVKALPQLEGPVLRQVLDQSAGRLEQHFGLRIGEEALQATVDSSLSEENPDFMPPGSTIRLLDEACAMARAEQAEEVTSEHVRRCFSEEEHEHPYIDRERLRGIEANLEKVVLGQDLAAGVVARRVRLAKMHLDRKPERPDGVFLFLGPSGVGKTALARGLARALYDDESRLVRLDMSEYMEPHSVARIIGAPPGYVGYGEEGALTGPVSRLGHCVVLLDEIEKAHPRVLNLFLQVFDDGRLTDSKGRLVSFSETVLIMTSNIGRELYAVHGEAAIGFGRKEDAPDQPLRDTVQDHLLRVLPAEFVNRIDEIVPFRVLLEDDMRRIAANLLVLEAERWQQRGKELLFDEDVAEVLALTGYDPRLGARHLERNLERLVISLISEAAITDEFDHARKLQLRVAAGVIGLEIDGVPFTGPHREGYDGPPPGQDARGDGAADGGSAER